MEAIIIKKASLSDLESIQKIGKETFYETFAPHNSEEQIQKYLTESFAEEKLTKELNNSYSEFYIAYDGENAVGYLKINFGNVQTELQDESSVEIERIYVKSSHHGKKVGQLLYSKAFGILPFQKTKNTFGWEFGKKINVPSISTKRMVLEEFDKHIFRLGNDEQTDLMMMKILN